MRARDHAAACPAPARPAAPASGRAPPCSPSRRENRCPARRASRARRLARSTPATPIWENPSSRPQPRSCASRASPSRTWDSCIAVLPILGTRLVHWPDEAACAASAAALAGARRRSRDAFIELHGPLGAGKTTFVRHLLHALGVDGRVKSPTYAVMEPYERPGHGGFAIAHFDFYRFDDPQEWEDAGFRDVFAEPGLKLVEWPEKAAGAAAALRPAPRPSLPRRAERGARRCGSRRSAPRGEELLRMTVSASRRQALRAHGRARPAARRARARLRRRDRRRARLAGRRLHARDDRVRRGARRRSTSWPRTRRAW